MHGAGFAVFAVWGYAIANADPHGFIELNPKALAPKLGGPESEVMSAIEYLRSPDPESGTKTEEGRRIVREGQFLHRIVNYEAYRKIWSAMERREYMRTYMQEYRKGERRRPPSDIDEKIPRQPRTRRERIQAEGSGVAQAHLARNGSGETFGNAGSSRK